MKFLTSSSSTASSTITTTTVSTFYSNVHNSRSTPAGCIAGVFRRLLCLNSLPPHPSHHHFKYPDHDSVSVELDKLQCATSTKTEDRVEASSTPSLVARLMGLESLPRIDFSANQKSPNSIARSRSMNSVDLMKELVSIQGRHRRVKSFRETAPLFLELEDEDFFILSFENDDESRKLGVKSRKWETGSKKMKESGKGENCKSKKSTTRRESVYEKNKENQGPMKVLHEKPERSMNSRKASQTAICDGKLKDSSNIVRPLNNCCQNSLVGKQVEKLSKPKSHKPESEVGMRRRMKKRKSDCLPVKKVETDQSDSENSSPNSVLDIMKIPCDQEVTSSEELPRLTNSKSRRTLTEELENYRKLNRQCIIDKSLISNNASCKSRTCSEGQCIDLRKNNQTGHNNYEEMWGEICKMAEIDTIQSNWMLNKEIQRFEDYKKISGEFEMQIFEELLGELMDQLVGNYHQNF